MAASVMSLSRRCLRTWPSVPYEEQECKRGVLWKKGVEAYKCTNRTKEVKKENTGLIF
jgi:hypothetical protein